MIVTFSVANFRSFNEEETFSLVASRKLSDDHENHLVPVPGSEASVLRAGVLYGANGAGKSNFFKALHYLRTMALRGRKKGTGTGRDRFQFANDETAPSMFDIQFIVGDKLYRYGLMADDERIIEEWLLSVHGNKEKPIFERVTDEAGNVTVKSKGGRGKNQKLNALMTVGGPKEQSFLATVLATLERSDFGDPIRTAIEWFEDGITFIQPDSNFRPLGLTLSEDEKFQRFASEFLRASSTGVDDLEVTKKELSEEQLKLMLPQHVFAKIVKGTEEEGKAIVGVGEGREVLIEKAGEHHYFQLTIQSVHRHEMSEVVHFDFAEESDGTRRLLNLLPALHRLHTDGGVFVIDEVERSMHPLLIRKFIEFFLSGCGGERRQLIVTTHESNLLDQNLLRRDEIWFTEKNKQGATKLYSLSDFQPRKDLKLDKHYLQGRFGAIPFLGDMNGLMRRETKTETERAET